MGNPWKARVERDNLLFCHEDSEDPNELVTTLFYSIICYSLLFQIWFYYTTGQIAYHLDDNGSIGGKAWCKES